MAEKQVKSRQRVADHGEVFTAEREVKAMCDLVKSETERIDSRFLEPACGDGNFLAEILRRKLAIVKQNYAPRRGSCHDYELYAVRSLMSLYGVELLHDNVLACRERLFRIFDEEYTSVCKKNASDEVRAVVRYVLEKNILQGDALALVQVDGDGQPTDKPIIFAFHGYPTLVHELTYERTNRNLSVHGYQEEGTITTPFDMRVQNEIDRFHLVKDALLHLPQLGNKGAYLIQQMNDKLVAHKNYIHEVGQDMPEILDWKWHLPENR